MNKKEKIQKIMSILDTLYPYPAIPLKHEDAYTLLIAVLLSAQCTDQRVNQVTPHLFAKAATPEQMVQLQPSEIEDIIRPCGLAPTKAKAIWNLSKILIEKYRGKVPKTMASLEKLPGVGHKTASVLMIQAYDQPAFPVDTHIHRCAARWKLSDGSSVKKTEQDLKKCFPKQAWKKLHLQIIYFAREHCPARKHNAQHCPICSWA